MLGAFLEITRAVTQESILAAFADNGMRDRLLKSNREAIETGRRLAGEIHPKGREN